MVNLFTKKWENETDFIEYFRRSYIIKNHNWFEGAQYNAPSTNNALESNNGVIKRVYTNRSRLPLNQFISLMAEMITDWSKQRSTDSTNVKTFKETPIPTLKEWTNAYQWALKKNNASEQVAFLNTLSFYAIRFPICILFF